MKSTDRKRIVEVARNHLLDHGLLDFSLRAVARDLGVTAPSLYRYFANRSALLNAVAERSFDVLDARLRQSLSGVDAHDRLARMAGAYLGFALDHPRDFAIVSLLPDGVDSRSRRLERRRIAAFRLWTDRVREAMDAGVLRSGPPEGVAVLLWSLAYGLITLHQRGAIDTPDDEAFRKLFWEAGVRAVEGLAGPEWSVHRMPAVVRRSIDP